METERVRMKMVFKDTHNSTLTGIQCLACGLVSWNANDAALHYCINCHKFGDLVPTTEVYHAPPQS